MITRWRRMRWWWFECVKYAKDEGKCDEMTRYAQVYRFARVAQNTFLWWSKWMEVLLKGDEERRRGRSRRNRVSLRYASVCNDSMRGLLRRVNGTRYWFGSVVRSNMKANSRLGDSSSLIRWQVIGSIREVSEEVDSGKNEVFSRSKWIRWNPMWPQSPETKEWLITM